VMRGSPWKQAAVLGILAVLLAATLIPFAMTILISQKPNAEVYSQFWSLPRELHSSYYTDAFGLLWGYMRNSILIGAAAAAGVLFLSSLSGFVFARMRFAGSGTLYAMLLALMMVPGILTLIPLFKWVLAVPLAGGNDIWGHGGTGLRNSWFGLWLPYWSGGQIFGILLCRTFCESIPEDLFEAARIDGASDFFIYRAIAVPLLLPILATLAILQFVGVYNDYIWPLVILSSPAKQVFAVGVTQFGAEGNLDLGPQMAGYLIGSIPLILVFAFGMRYYVQGLTSGALKA